MVPCTNKEPVILLPLRSNTFKFLKFAYPTSTEKKKKISWEIIYKKSKLFDVQKNKILKHTFVVFEAFTETIALQE